jgi:hypothetical protein
MVGGRSFSFCHPLKRKTACLRRLSGWRDALKAEAIRREIRRAEGEDFRITLTPPGISQRTDKPLLLRVLGIAEAEYAARFCHPVQTGWRLTCTPRRKFETAA